MKKVISLLLVLLLVGCSSTNKEENVTDTKKEDTSGIIENEQGKKMINVKDLHNYVKKVEVTKDNLSKIFDFHEVEIEEKDDFGEVTNAYTHILYCQDENYTCSSDFNLRLHEKSNDVYLNLMPDLLWIYKRDNGQYYIMYHKDGIDEIDLDKGNLEFDASVGYLIWVNLPTDCVYYDDNSSFGEIYCYEEGDGITCESSYILDDFAIEIIADMAEKYAE